MRINFILHNLTANLTCVFVIPGLMMSFTDNAFDAYVHASICGWHNDKGTLGQYCGTGRGCTSTVNTDQWRYAVY